MEGISNPARGDVRRSTAVLVVDTMLERRRSTLSISRNACRGRAVDLLQDRHWLQLPLAESSKYNVKGLLSERWREFLAP